jgi:hypothetical protein
MRNAYIYSLILIAVSIATLALYIKNPALSSSNIHYDFTEELKTTLTTEPKQTQNNAAVRKETINSTSTASSKGLHLCTCLTPDNTDTHETPHRLRWLHFPKTGTSFISTLWSYACSTRERYIDLEISSFQCDIFTRNAFSMYDFALMR